MENIWQFSKVYPRVDATSFVVSRYDPRPTWEHPAEQHVADAGKPLSLANLTEKYWAWRRKGMECPHPIRYPPGFGKMAACLGSFAEKEVNGEVTYTGPLSYIESRKALYLPLYCSLVKKSPLFHALKRRVASGENILLIEIDGPHEESNKYYREKYGTEDDFVKRKSILADHRSLDILLNDPKHPFGHGYCLAAALLGIDGELVAEVETPISDSELDKILCL